MARARLHWEQLSWTFDGQPFTPTDHEARVRAILGKGQSRELTITCPFEPESIIVDPDAKVLQLQRNNAFVKF